MTTFDSIEGTGTELKQYLIEHPHKWFRLTEIAAPDPNTPQVAAMMEAKREAAVAMLNRRIAEYEAATEEERAEAERELEELMHNLNENRVAAGEMPMFS